jgi:hypothetical protein
MRSFEICGVTVLVDVDLTRQAYVAIAASSTGHCECAYCRNFRAQVEPPFPPGVMAFLSETGIDLAQPAETYHLGESEPGRHIYGGEYYFFGAAPVAEPMLDQTEQFRFTFTQPSGLAQDISRTSGAVCFNFIVEIPWVLADAA